MGQAVPENLLPNDLARGAIRFCALQLQGHVCRYCGEGGVIEWSRAELVCTRAVSNVPLRCFRQHAKADNDTPNENAGQAARSGLVIKFS